MSSFTSCWQTLSPLAWFSNLAGGHSLLAKAWGPSRSLLSDLGADCCLGKASGVSVPALRMVCSIQILWTPSAGPGLPLGQSYLQMPAVYSLNLSFLHSFSISPLLNSHSPFPSWSYPTPFSFHSPSIPLPLSFYPQQPSIPSFHPSTLFPFSFSISFPPHFLSIKCFVRGLNGMIKCPFLA